MNPLSRGLTRALDRGRRRVDALTNDVQDDPRPARAASDGMSRDERFGKINGALRRASLELDTALALAQAENVPFLMGDLPRVQEDVDLLVAGLREYRKNEQGDQG